MTYSRAARGEDDAGNPRLSSLLHEQWVYFSLCHWCFFFFFLSRGLPMKSRLFPNSQWRSCLRFPRAGITSIHPHSLVHGAFSLTMFFNEFHLPSKLRKCILLFLWVAKSCWNHNKQWALLFPPKTWKPNTYKGTQSLGSTWSFLSRGSDPIFPERQDLPRERQGGGHRRWIAAKSASEEDGWGLRVSCELPNRVR